MRLSANIWQTLEALGRAGATSFESAIDPPSTGAGGALIRRQLATRQIRHKDDGTQRTVYWLTAAGVAEYSAQLEGRP